MPLYRVTVKRYDSVAVLASTELEAQKWAERNAEALMERSLSIWTARVESEIQHEGQLPPGWDGGTLVYNVEGCLTAEAAIAGKLPAPTPSGRTRRSRDLR